MERVRVINNGRIITKGKSKSKIGSMLVDAKQLLLSTAVVLLFIFFNAKSYASLYTEARNNENLRQQLITLKKENSSLEEKKANLVNIREIQRKANELGFVHNNKVNYIK